MKKRRGGVILIVLGLVLAAAVGFEVYTVSNRAMPDEVDTAAVLVTLSDVPERTVLTAAMLSVKKTLLDAVPPGAVTRPEDAIGKMTTDRIFTGEIVLNGKLADTGGRSGVSYTLDAGKVVITVPASDIITTRAIQPGDRVDLLMTLTEKPAPGTGAAVASVLPPTTQTTMQGLEVLGIGPFPAIGAAPTEGKQSEATGNLITFAVSHQDALVIKALKDSTEVQMEMVLRAAGDDEIVSTSPVTMDAIIQRYRLSGR